jgi:predicted metal-dependent HD superfamily phosphohydrolase
MLHARHAPWQLPVALLDELQVAYATPPRPYHSLDHIQEVLGWFDQVGNAGQWRDALTVHAAILFHDAIYVAGRSDNEALSAQLALQSLPRHSWPGSITQLQRVAALIELTARHGKLTAADLDTDAALFLDCDTAILAASRTAFEAYDAGIAAEYQHIPALTFRMGRSQFLRNMLNQPRIFLSDFFHMRFDAAARSNIAWTLERYA